MKYRFVLILCMCSSYFFAQSNTVDVDKANSEFENLNYINAIEIYESVVESGVEDPKLIHRLASANYFNGNYDAAVKWYNKYYALQNIIPKPIDDYRYGQALKTQKKYEQADRLLAKYYELKGMRYTSILDGKQQDTLSNDNLFNIKEFNYNTDLSEYPAYIEADKAYVVGKRLENDKKKKRQRYPKSDIYTFDTSTGIYTPLSEEVNSPYNEGSLVITNDGNTMFFSRNDYLKDRLRTNKDDISTINIYIAEFKNGTWKNVKAFPFNSEEYSVGHPALSPDNKTLYFISDKPGGKGGTDLYKVPFFENGTFGNPKNMTDINTAENEMFPFIDKKDGTLYFSSNRPESKGGLDIFISKLNDDNVYKRAYNIGEQINSSYDDFAFVVNMAGDGFYSSNKVNDIGLDDIYSFKMLREFQVPIFLKLKGQIIDMETNTPLNDVALTLFDRNDNELGRTRTSTDGTYELPEVKGSEIAYIKAEKPRYKTVEKNVDSKIIQNKEPLSFNMQDVGSELPENIVVSGRLMDTKTGESISDATIKVLDINNNVLGEVKTNKDATYNLKDIPTDKASFIRIEKEGYQTEEFEIDPRKIVKGTLTDDNTIARSNVPIELGNDISTILNTIYFDYGKATIRPDAEIELEKIIKVLEKFPSMSIKIESHTDSQGSASYNLALSQRRAKSTYQYILGNGISKNRLSYKGYGEKMIINRCKNGVDCLDQEHQRNRRSAFKITKI